MSQYAVIVQNDESQWSDVKGELYHFPRIYKRILVPGCEVVYYKGVMKNKRFATSRLTPEAHYFGRATVGPSILDEDSKKGDRYCEILSYQPFLHPVPIKLDDQYVERIPPGRTKNYWRNGVRAIDRDVYERILSQASLKNYIPELPNVVGDLESFAISEGGRKERYSSYYERNPICRAKAIEIHGTSCMTCGFNFLERYGDRGRGYIHVHHLKPLSESGVTKVDPRSDLAVVCPNCHAMIHRDKNNVLTLDELRSLLER